MKAVTIEPNNQLVVREHDDAKAGVGEVLIRIRAVGVNGADLAQMAGAYPAPPGSPPDIPGLELAGEVVATGPSAYRFSIGDRVMGIAGGGAQAELMAVHERQLMLVPETLDWAQAGGFPEAFITAHDALFTQAGLRPGERVLITGAAGGVGIAGVQIAAMSSAQVIASVRNAANRDAVMGLGAAKAIDPLEAEANGPYDVVLELVNASNLNSSLRSLNVGGRIIIIAGAKPGTEAMLDVGLLMKKRATVRASTLRARPLEEKALATRAVEREVLPNVATGKIAVPIAATYSLAEAAAAYDAFKTPGKFGKIIVLL